MAERGTEPWHWWRAVFILKAGVEPQGYVLRSRGSGGVSFGTFDNVVEMRPLILIPVSSSALERGDETGSSRSIS